MAEHHDDEQRRTQLSAIMDGAADPAELRQWLAQDARRPEALADWHAYHLIGDVLRSPDLAASAQHDQRLFSRIQQAVAQEPVVLAPGALPEPTQASPTWEARAGDHQLPQVANARAGARVAPMRRRLWAGTAAAVAGFAVVATAFITTRADFGDGPVISLAGVAQPQEDIRRAAVMPQGATAAADTPMNQSASQAPFREILRLPRGPAHSPLESVQVLYSNGSATISVLVEPFRQGEHVPRTESSERLNTLTVQRQDVWLTLSGDVPLGTLQQMALALPSRP